MKPWMAMMVATLAAVVGGCVRKDTRVLAQEKEYLPPATTAPWKISGVFDQKELTVVLSFNCENVLRGLRSRGMAGA